MKRIGILVVLFLTLTIEILAAPPQYIKFQGQLLDNQGKAITGTKNVTFTIYDAETGGNDVWSNNQDVSFSEFGIYDVTFGPITLQFQDPYWLEIKIGAETLSPRYRFTSVPYAFYASSSTYAQSAGNMGGDIAPAQIKAGALDSDVVVSSIAVNAVYTDAILSVAVTGDKISGTIVSTHIVDGSLTNADISASAAISASKLESAVMLEGENVSLLNNDAGYLTSESDSVVGTINGLVKADGAGNISKAVAGTDYLTPTGDGSGLSGVVTSEADPIFAAAEAYNITASSTTDWNTAYGWGNHAGLYLTAPATFTYVSSEADPIFAAAEAYNITSSSTTDWNTAYGWGDHSAVGYAGLDSVNTWTSSQTITAPEGLLVNYGVKMGTATASDAMYIGGGATISTITASGLSADTIIASNTTSSRLHLPNLASTDFQTLTPTDTGDLYYNTDLRVICVSTGTANPGDFSRMDGATSCW